MENSFKDRVRKITLYDDRLIQKMPSYAINRGATDLKLSTVPASSQSQDTISVLIQPSGFRTMVDRYISSSVTINGYFDVTITAGPLGDDEENPVVEANTAIFVYGRDGACQAYPFHNGCVSDINLEINDQNFNIETEDINQAILRLMKSSKSGPHTCPYMLDKVVNYVDANNSNLNVLGTMYDANNMEIPNGAFNFQLTDASGAKLQNGRNYGDGSQNGGPLSLYLTQYTYNGDTNQVQMVDGLDADDSATYRLYYKLTTVEPVMCPPLAFDESQVKESSLFEIKNIKIDYNIKRNINVIKSAGDVGGGILSREISEQGLNTNSQGAGQNTSFPFTAKFLVYMLSPPLDLVLPSECVVPNQVFTRTKVGGSSVAGGASGNITSTVIPISIIPDKLIIYVRPDSYPFTQGSWTLQLADLSPLSIDFGDKSSLLSGMTWSDLYKISYQNGLKMDSLSWYGSGNVMDSEQFKSIPLIGPYIVLTPGIDFPLPAGMAAGMGVRTTMQININYVNQSADPVTPVLYVVQMQSGFVRFMNGDSIIEKDIVSPAEALSPQEIIPQMALNRAVGSGLFNRANNNYLHKGNYKFKKVGGKSYTAAGHPPSVQHSKKPSKKTASRRAY